MTRAQEIATIIRGQITAMRGPFVPMSWGWNTFIAMPETKRFDNFMEGGLKFKVQGSLFKGWIIVWLTGSDDYTVEFAQTRKGEWITVEKLEGLYAEDLTDAIDRRVEKPARRVA